LGKASPANGGAFSFARFPSWIFTEIGRAARFERPGSIPLTLHRTPPLPFVQRRVSAHAGDDPSRVRMSARLSGAPCFNLFF